MDSVTVIRNLLTLLWKDNTEKSIILNLKKVIDYAIKGRSLWHANQIQW